jgi:hypothetical protein
MRPFRGDFEKEIQTNFKGANDNYTTHEWLRVIF